ncbi:restriction endonuclease subunit S [Streptomyces sp. NPDC001940]
MSEWEQVRLDEVIALDVDAVPVTATTSYDIVGVLNRGRGLLFREPIAGDETSYKTLNRIRPNQIVYSRLKAFEGAITVAPNDLGEVYASQEFPTFTCGERMLPEYFRLLTTTKRLWEQLQALSTGMGGRRERVKPADFLTMEVALPSLSAQRRIVDAVSALDAQVEALEVEFAHVELVLDAMLTMETYGGAEWPRHDFSDVIDFREGPGIMARDFRDAGVPLIRLAGLTPGESILAKCNYLDPQKVDAKWSHFRVELGDVLLSTSAALGRVAVVDAEGVGAIPYTGIIRMRPATDLVEPSYIPWLLRSADFASQIADAGVGTTMAHFGPTHLRKMTIPLPPVETQLSIAETLRQVHANQLDIASELTNLRAFRSALLSSLLNQEIEIPESYDALLEEVS